MTVNEKLTDKMRVIRRYTTKGGHSIVVVEFNEPKVSYMTCCEQDDVSDPIFTTFHNAKSDAVQMAQFHQYVLETQWEKNNA